MYKCKYCKKEFKKKEKQAFAGHSGHCKRKILGIEDDRFGDSRKWKKGLTKETNLGIKKQAEKQRKRLLKLGENNPLQKWNRNRTEEEFKNANLKQSETRKRLYREGKLFPAKGIGRGKYSYLIYENNKILLRSTYEFFFALYLLYRNIKFNYENIRVQYNGHTRVNDFEIKEKIYEIKGIRGSHVDEVVKAFKTNKYKIRIVYAKTIHEIEKFLKRKGFNTNKLREKIHEGHKTKKYFVYKYK